VNTPGAGQWFAAFLQATPAAREEIAKAAISLVTPEETMGYLLKSWRKEQDAKPINLDTKLQAALNKCPWQWIDGTAVHFGYGKKGTKRDKIAAIVAHLADADKLRGVVAGLPPQGRDALALVLKNGWVKYGDLTRRFGSEERDSWWWADEPPTSVLGQVRLAGLLFVGTAGLAGRNYKVAVVPVDLRQHLKALHNT